MNYNEKELETIEEMASLFYSYRDIAIVLEVNVNDFIAEMRIEEGEAFARYENSFT